MSIGFEIFQIKISVKRQGHCRIVAQFVRHKLGIFLYKNIYLHAMNYVIYRNQRDTTHHMRWLCL